MDDVDVWFMDAVRENISQDHRARVKELKPAAGTEIMALNPHPGRILEHAMLGIPLSISVWHHAQPGVTFSIIPPL